MPSVIRWKLITNRRVWAPMISFPVIALYMGRLMTHLNRQLTKLFTPPDSQEGFLTRCHFSFPFYSCSVMWLWKNKNNCLKRELCKVGELHLKLHLFLLVNYKSAQLQWKYSESAFPVFFFFNKDCTSQYFLWEFLFFSEIVFAFCKNMGKPNKFILTVMKGFEVILK